MKLEMEFEPTGLTGTIAERLKTMRERVDIVARRAGRKPSEITLIGVTKKHPLSDVLEAIDAGLGDIAESYVQEAREKLAGLPPVRKHFVGHIQTNKAKAIVEAFDVVQSIDRLDAALAIAKASRNLAKPVRVLLQLNISPTERFGLAPADVPALAARLRADEGLAIDGVMAIGPNTSDRAEIGRAFRLAAESCSAIGGTTLSLGMSGDWEEAIECGSTMLRIGTAIFGERE